MGRLCSSGIKEIPRRDPSTLRPAGLGSLRGPQRCVTHPFFVEPQELVTGIPAPHPNVSRSLLRAHTVDNVAANVKAEELTVLRSPASDSGFEAGRERDVNGCTQTPDGEDACMANAPYSDLARYTAAARNGVPHGGPQEAAQSLTEICLCLEPDAHEQPPVKPPRPSKGVGSAAFRERHIGHQHLLQHVPGPQCSSSIDECNDKDKRVGIRTQYYPHDTYSRIFATQPFAGKIRVRGELAMKLYMRNFSACPEEQSEPIKQKKRHVRPADHFNLFSDTSTSEACGGNNATGEPSGNPRICPSNVNKVQTDFMTWRTPHTQAEFRDRYSIKLVSHRPGAGDVLSWSAPWKHDEKGTEAVTACNTPVKDDRDPAGPNKLLNPWAGLTSSAAPSRIASARKLADYTGNGIFDFASAANTPRPDFASLRKMMAAEERAFRPTPAVARA